MQYLFLSLPQDSFPIFPSNMSVIWVSHNAAKALCLPFCRFTDTKSRRKCVLISWAADLSVCVEMHLLIQIISCKKALLFL